MLSKLDAVHEAFRLWITAEPHPAFPIGLLQMGLKITNEAPVGVKAGLRASYQWITQVGRWAQPLSSSEVPAARLTCSAYRPRRERGDMHTAHVLAEATLDLATASLLSSSLCYMQAC